MAFYGDIYLDPGAQGDSGSTGLGDGGIDLTEKLALAWLTEAARRAGDRRDRQDAERELNLLSAPPTGAQGRGAVLRPAARALSRLRWFAPFGIATAEKFVFKALGEVTGYLTDDKIREYAQQRVLGLISSETRLVIAHSLGSVVAYEALHRTDRPVTFVTLGSPLGLRSIVYPKLRPQPPTVPSSMTRWYNIADRDDLVATELDLDFEPVAGHTTKPETIDTIDNGSSPHDAARYLTKRTLGAIVVRALEGTGH